MSTYCLSMWSGGLAAGFIWYVNATPTAVKSLIFLVPCNSIYSEHLDNVLNCEHDVVAANKKKAKEAAASQVLDAIEAGKLQVPAKPSKPKPVTKTVRGTINSFIIVWNYCDNSWSRYFSFTIEACIILIKLKVGSIWRKSDFSRLLLCNQYFSFLHLRIPDSSLNSEFFVYAHIDQIYCCIPTPEEITNPVKRNPFQYTIGQWWTGGGMGVRNFTMYEHENCLWFV